MFFAAALVLAAHPAAAQTAPDETEPGAASAGSAGSWRLYPNERHIVVRADNGFPGYGYSLNRTTLPVPSAGYCPTLGLGVEVGVGAAFYVTSGIAITAEGIFDVYFGDSRIVFPIVGGGLGVMVDYEVLP